MMSNLSNSIFPIFLNPKKEDTIYAAGHSAWIKNFVKNFYAQKHKLKKKKVKNGSAVVLKVKKMSDGEGNVSYEIVENSAKLFHGDLKK